jgi:hypothetical protein
MLAGPLDRGISCGDLELSGSTAMPTKGPKVLRQRDEVSILVAGTAHYKVEEMRTAVGLAAISLNSFQTSSKKVKSGCVPDAKSDSR